MHVCSWSQRESVLQPCHAWQACVHDFLACPLEMSRMQWDEAVPV